MHYQSASSRNLTHSQLYISSIFLTRFQLPVAPSTLTIPIFPLPTLRRAGFSIAIRSAVFLHCSLRGKCSVIEVIEGYQEGKLAEIIRRLEMLNRMTGKQGEFKFQFAAEIGNDTGAQIRQSGQNLSERGASKRALNGISFDVEAGEIVGFLGPNGAGKTTAMHVLMDILFPTSGRAEIMGLDSRDPRSRQQVGFLPEIFAFDGFLTGARFLKLFGSLGGRNKDLVAAHIPELLAFLDMPDAANVRIKNYSKGMMQKIGLAQH